MNPLDSAPSSDELMSMESLKALVAANTARVARLCAAVGVQFDAPQESTPPPTPIKESTPPHTPTLQPRHDAEHDDDNLDLPEAFASVPLHAVLEFQPPTPTRCSTQCSPASPADASVVMPASDRGTSPSTMLGSSRRPLQLDGDKDSRCIEANGDSRAYVSTRDSPSDPLPASFLPPPIGAPPALAPRTRLVPSTGKMTAEVLSTHSDPGGSSPLQLDGHQDSGLTHIGAMSIFVELCLGYAEERFTKRPSRDIVWDEELTDGVVTHIGGLSLFLEQIMDNHQEFERARVKPTCLYHRESGTGLVFPTVPSTQGRRQLLPSGELLHGTNIATIFMPWDPGVRIIFAEVPELSEAAINGTDDWSSWLRCGSYQGFGDSLHNTKLFSQGIGMSAGPYSMAVVKLEQGQQASCSRYFHMFGDTIMGLIRTFDVVLHCTSLCQTEVKMHKYVIDADHLTIMEDTLDTRVVFSLSCTSTSPRLIILLNFSLEENTEKGIMLMGMNLRNHGYAFYFSWQSRLHTPKSDFLMWLADSGILFAPRALTSDAYDVDSVQALEMQCELQNFLCSISSNADRKHIRVQLISLENEFLSLEAFKGSVASISSYIQLAWLYKLLFAPRQCPCISSIEGATMANTLEQARVLLICCFQVVQVIASMDGHTIFRQISPWSRQGFNPGDKDQQVLYMCQNFFSLICSESYLQYKQWDPGIKWVRVESLSMLAKVRENSCRISKNKQNISRQNLEMQVVATCTSLLTNCMHISVFMMAGSEQRARTLNRHVFIDQLGGKPVFKGEGMPRPQQTWAVGQPTGLVVGQLGEYKSSSS